MNSEPVNGYHVFKYHNVAKAGDAVDPRRQGWGPASAGYHRLSRRVNKMAGFSLFMDVTVGGFLNNASWMLNQMLFLVFFFCCHVVYATLGFMSDITWPAKKLERHIRPSEATELRPFHSRQGEFQIDKMFFFMLWVRWNEVGSLYTYFFTPRIILDH